MERDISDSVGDPKQGAVNRDSDVRTVQGLLNTKVVKDGRSDRFLAVDGRIDSATVGAISAFQRRSSLAQSGLIRRGDATIRALARFNGPSSMHVSGNLVDWLENNPSIENFSATPYDDAHRPTPNATIGFGHKLHSGPVTEADRHKWANGISRFEAARLLRDDLRESEGEVNRDVKVPLRQSQFDSLVSLTFNIGADNFRGSALLRLLNDGDYLGAAAQFEAWTRSGSSHPRGLRTRRDEEKARFERR